MSGKSSVRGGASDFVITGKLGGSQAPRTGHDYRSTELVVYTPEGPRRVSVGDLEGCRTLLLRSKPELWCEVHGVTYRRPVSCMRAFFGLLQSQVYGPAARDILDPKSGEVRVKKGEQIPNGGWKVPFSDDQTQVWFIKYPTSLSPSGSCWAQWQDRQTGLQTEGWRHLDKSECQFLGWMFQSLAERPSVCLAYHSDSGMVLVTQHKGRQGWLSYLRAEGISILDGAKTDKRLRFLGTPQALTGEFSTDELTVHVMSSEDEARLASLYDLPREQVGDCHDGFGAIDQQTVKQMIEGCWPGQDEDSRQTREWLLSVRSFTCRGFLDGKFVKCKVHVSDSPAGGANLVIHPVNFKKELTGPQGKILLWLTPSDGKDEARLDIQTSLQLVDTGVIPEASVLRWGRSELLKVYHEVTSGELAERLEAVCHLSGEAVQDGRWQEMKSALLLARFRSMHWVREGFRDFSNSPSLARTTWQAHTKRMVASVNPRTGLPTSDRIHVTVPGAVLWQVLPDCTQWSLGMDCQPVTPGEILQVPGRRVSFVASSLCLSNSKDNHGGGDMDDQYVQFQCTDVRDGTHKVLVTRCPNMMGEWSVYRPATDWTKKDCLFTADGNLENYQGCSVSWPAFDLGKLPPRVGDLVAQGKLKVCVFQKRKVALTSYCPHHLAGNLSRRLGSCKVGTSVNAIMAYTHGLGRLPAELMASMEGFVDAAQQQDATGDLGWKVRKEAQKLINQAVELGGEFDVTFWSSRGLYASKDPVLVQGWITKVQLELASLQKELTGKLEDWIRSEARPCKTSQSMWDKADLDTRKAATAVVHEYRSAWAELIKQHGNDPKKVPDTAAEMLNEELFRQVQELDLKVPLLAVVLLTEGRKSDGKLSDGCLFAHEGLWSAYMADLRQAEAGA